MNNACQQDSHICSCCGRWRRDIKRRRQNTEYADEESNYITVCMECYEQIVDYWNERWEEYWASRL